MKAGWMIVPACLMLAGCASAPTGIAGDDLAVPEEPPRPTILFPDYLLMERFSLNDHGIIPGMGLIGADMTVADDLASVRNLISEQLSLHEWNTDKMEIGRQYFRVLASHDGEEIEIRAVQGTGPTQVFLLYRPAAARDTP
ncbi:MAG TPA: hypothetical protein VLL07_07330 [Pontiella sp.]|nr:hypothetical protein [Pontiella sp.]